MTGHAARILALEPSAPGFRPRTDVKTVNGTDDVRTALGQMLTQQYTQLPVVDDAGTVVGMVTVWSVLRGLCRDSDPRNLLNAWVEDYVEAPEYVHAAAPADHLLTRLRQDRALLIGSPEAVQGIVTADDVLRHFMDLSKPYVILGEIEESVRDLIRSCVPDLELPSALQAALSSKKTGVPSRLEDCTFEDYRLVIICKHNRTHFAHVIGPSAGALSSRLAHVRDLRNRVMHFKDPVDADEMAVLQEARTWLEAKLARARRATAAEDVA